MNAGAERDLGSFIEEHLRRRRDERLSVGRLYEDRRALYGLERKLSERFGSAPIAPSSVTREDLHDFLLELQRNSLSASSISALVSSLHVFFEDLFTRGVIAENAAVTLRRPREQSLPRNVPSQEDVARLLDAPPKTTEAGLRDRAILELLYGSGLRRIEALRLQLSDLNLAERTLFVREGKGKKDRAVPITDAAARAIAAYIDRRPLSRHRELFLGVNSDKPLHVVCFRLAWKRYVEKAGLPAINPHALRHACALHLLEGGADVVSVKNLLGHASIDTTALYLRLTTRHLKDAIEEHHPRGRRHARADTLPR